MSFTSITTFELLGQIADENLARPSTGAGRAERKRSRKALVIMCINLLLLPVVPTQRPICMRGRDLTALYPLCR
jgi:hypothetical protein